MSIVVREPLPGCFELQPRVASDPRGRFVKAFQRDLMRELGWENEIVELYYSRSWAGVLRGLHLQVEPHAHDKLVAAVEGDVVDAILDLRPHSPTCGQHAMIALSAHTGNVLLVARGVAHGFCVPEGSATLLYAVTSAYDASSDTGVRWDSAGIGWPVSQPLVSDRDAALPTMAEFLSRRGR
jgi:dTDP-4-dehydrorhamnose 3,5-epimerase